MKKKYAILISVLATALLAVLFLPIPVGEGQFSALTYKIIPWNKPILTLEGETLYGETSVYFFPRNFTDPDILWAEELAQNPALSTAAEKGFYATVVSLSDKSIVVDGVDSNPTEHLGLFSLSLSEKTELLQGNKPIPASQIKVGDCLFVEYNGVVAESYPAQILHLVRLSVMEYGPDEFPAKIENLTRIRVDGTGDSAALFAPYTVEGQPLMKIDSPSALENLFDRLRASEEYQKGWFTGGTLFTELSDLCKEDFFEEKDLILIYVSENSGSNLHSVHLKPQRFQCTVYVKTLIPNGQTCDMAGWILAFPMEKSVTEGRTFSCVRLSERYDPSAPDAIRP